ETHRWEREEVREQPEGPPHPRGQLAIERVTAVDVGATPVVGNEQPAALRILARVSAGEERAVAPVPFAKEIPTPLSYPAVEIRVHDLVGHLKEGMLGLQDADGGRLVGDTVAGLAVWEGVRTHARPLITVWLVLDDQRPPAVHVLEEPGSRCAKLGTRRVGAVTDHDRVEAEQAKALELRVGGRGGPG